jgi:hypothetical protein
MKILPFARAEGNLSGCIDTLCIASGQSPRPELGINSKKSDVM